MIKSRVVQAAILASSVIFAGRAQTSSCKDMVYEHRNQIDNKPFEVKALEGVVQDMKKFRVPKACVGVFTELEHQLVAVAEASEKGEFNVRGVPNGDYRIVIRYAGLCPANASIRLRQNS